MSKFADKQGKVYTLGEYKQFEVIHKSSTKVSGWTIYFMVIMCFPVALGMLVWNEAIGKDTYKIVLTTKSGIDKVATVDETTYNLLIDTFHVNKG